MNIVNFRVWKMFLVGENPIKVDLNYFKRRSMAVSTAINMKDTSLLLISLSLYQVL